MKTKPAFTQENTEGYSILDLATLNQMYETEIMRYGIGARNNKSLCDAVAETILQRFDRDRE